MRTEHTYDFKWRRKTAQRFADRVADHRGWTKSDTCRHPLTVETVAWLRWLVACEAEDLIVKAAARERKRLREGKVIRQGRA